MKAYIHLPLLAIVLLSAVPKIYADMNSDDKTTVEEIKQEATDKQIHVFA